MAYFHKKTVLKYLYNQLTGNFAGFVIGMSASGLLSNFFETRSIRNLWGLGSKKTIIDKQTFENLEWIISIVIGFIVFEIITKVVKEKVDQYFPIYRIKFYRWILNRKIPVKAKEYFYFVNNKRIVLIAGFGKSLRNTYSKFSKQ